MKAGCKKKQAAVSGYISMEKGKFLLAGKRYCPVFYVSDGDYEGVKRAANDLCSDVELITGVLPEMQRNTEGANVLIGTLGRNPAIDLLIEEKRLDVSAIEGKWEGFQIQLVENVLVIVGSDKRGTIFGIYDLCEKIGVSPWKWWADVKPGYAENLYVDLKEPYVEAESSVKYRGIFINDEYAFDNWALNRNDIDFVETYKRVYELLLRLKANMLWPAMHGGSPCFHKNILNTINAEKYGIVIGTSHCEMLLRNNVSEYFEFEAKWEQENPDKILYKKKLSDSPTPCAYVYTDKNTETGEVVNNKEFLYEYWRDSIQKYGIYECIFTMGMRGLHDATWQPTVDTLAEKRALLEEIIGVQRSLLQETLQRPAEEIPQLFIPYKEIQEIYDSGMEIPDDMMLMWTDDNYGYIRQLPTDENRNRRGGAGIYYHVGYHGSPNSYIWLSTTPYALIREEMCKAFDCGAGNIWVLNVGDLKPAEGRLEYFLNLGRNIEAIRKMDLEEYISQKALRDFGFDTEAAKEYAEIELAFQRLAYARKPEHFQSDLFNYEEYGDEGGRYLSQYFEVLKRSESLYASLDKADKPSFFQLQLYPLRSCYHMAAKYINADKARLYMAQGRGSAVNKYSMQSDKAYFDLLRDTKEYNSMLDGKWNMLMDPYQPYFQSRRAILSSLLEKPVCSELGYSKLGVSAKEELVFYGSIKNKHFIDIYNEGKGYIDWEISSDKSWVKPGQNAGTVYQDERVWIAIDWNEISEGIESAVLTVRGMEKDKQWHNVEILITVDNRNRDLQKGVFVETAGYISIEAEHFTHDRCKDQACWKVEKHLGRNGDALKLYPNLLSSVEYPDENNSAFVTYPVYFDSVGTFTMEVYRIPTLNERGRVRFAVGLDSAKPIILEGTRAYVNDSDGTDSWGKGVYENTEILTARIDVKEKGKHDLRIYQVDAGIVLDKIVIYTEEKKESYFGPLETRVGKIC